jgi:hypothetical protein
VSRVLSRLLRLLEQDRIQLPRRALEPRDIRPGDRLQIGQETWWVGEGRSSSDPAGAWFALTAEAASAPAAVLCAPGPSKGRRSRMWLLIRGGDRFEVPGEMIVHFPSGARTTLGAERRAR